MQVVSSRGVFKSTDRGVSWGQVSTGFPDVRGGFLPVILAVDPLTPTTIYAETGVVDWYPGGSVFRSTDGGETWNAINDGLVNSSLSFFKLTVDARNVRRIAVGTWGGGVFVLREREQDATGNVASSR